MKTLQVFFGVGAVVVLLGANVAMAEIRFRSTERPVEFTPSFETVDGTVTMPTLSFCNIDSLGGPEAQQTCAMTPGGASAGLLTELPILPPTSPTYTTPMPSTAFSPGTIPGPSPYNETWTRYRNGGGGGGEVPREPPDIEVEIPEPATLLMVGLGITGVAVARRRGRKV